MSYIRSQCLLELMQFVSYMKMIVD